MFSGVGHYFKKLFTYMTEPIALTNSTSTALTTMGPCSVGLTLPEQPLCIASTEQQLEQSASSAKPPIKRRGSPPTSESMPKKLRRTSECSPGKASPQGGPATGSAGGSPSVLQHPAAHVLHSRHASHHEADGGDIALQEEVFSPSFHAPHEHQQAASPQASPQSTGGPGPSPTSNASLQSSQHELLTSEDLGGVDDEFDDNAENKQAAHAPGGAEGSLMTLPHHYRMVPAPGAAAQQQPDNAQQAGTSTAAAGTSSNAAATAPPAAQPAAARQQAEEEDDGVDFDPLLFIKQLPALEACVPKLRPNILPKKTRICKRMTLVLDLDETLVHSSLEAVDNCDFSFPVTFNNMEHTVYVRQRPHLAAFMERVSSLFEVVIFTASQKIYAERLLSILDPGSRLVKHRIYRDSCVIVEGNYLKDLTILGRDLSQMAIVDNSPQAFGFQVDNGIPIESWYEDEADEELLHLLPFLERLAEAEDVRPLIREQYRLQELIDLA